MIQSRNDLLISFVVPVFNVSECIKDLILSFVDAEIEIPYEIIFVNDCSTDVSLSVIESLSQKYIDLPITIIDLQQNQGLSVARNEGVKVSKGEYVFFLDGDDFLISYNFHLLSSLLKQNKPDCIAFDFDYFYNYQDKKPSGGCAFLKKRKVLTEPESFISATFNTGQLYVWRHLIKREIISKYPFPIGKNYEDISVIPKALSGCRSFYYFDIPLVNYRQREGSIMKVKSSNNILALSESLIDPMQYIYAKYGKENKQLFYSLQRFNLLIFTWCCGDTLANLTLDPKSIYPRIRNNFKRYNELNLNRKSLIKNRKNLHIPYLDLIKFWLFYRFPKLFYISFFMKKEYPKTYKLLKSVLFR